LSRWVFQTDSRTSRVLRWGRLAAVKACRGWIVWKQVREIAVEVVGDVRCSWWSLALTDIA
jgi:hypothetical protein